MKAYIDRIEDGKIAVVIVEKMGQLLVPVKKFPFEIHEGMHLKIKFEPDPESEKKTGEAVRKLQQELIRKSKEK